MRSLAILAAVLATASAYGVMETPDNQCIVAGKTANKETALTLGECDADNVVEFKFTKQDSTIKTSDGKCVAVSEDSDEDGAKVVIATCKPTKKAGKKWTLLEGNEWVNGNDLCLSFDEEMDSLIQTDCKNATELALDGCKVEPLVAETSSVAAATATATIVTPIPTITPAPEPYTCGKYVASVGPNACAPGFFVPSNYYNFVCTGTGCAQTCCVPMPPKPRTCAEFAASSGVYPAGNVCGKYLEFTPYPGTQCTTDEDCMKRCCVKPQPTEQSCKAWASSPYNGCMPGSQLIADAASTMCPTGQASKACYDTCCEPFVPPVVIEPTNRNVTCGEWQELGNKCPPGKTQWPNVYINCFDDGEDCPDKCCRNL